MTKKKILIIDDDKIFSKILRDGLMTKDKDRYEIINAYDGEEGLQIADEKIPDLIILDLLMPKIGGIDFLKKIRTNSKLANVSVVISSQLSDMEKISKGMELDIKGYIIKSDYSLEGIIHQINNILEEK